jgi:hypothetical protein
LKAPGALNPWIRSLRFAGSLDEALKPESVGAVKRADRLREKPFVLRGFGANFARVNPGLHTDSSRLD